MKPVTHQDLAEFAQNMAKFMRGGLDMLNAFDAAAASTDSVSAGILIRQMKEQMEHGDSLREVCRSRTRYLDDICGAIAESGERHGQQGLIDAFEAIALYQGRIQPHLHVEYDDSRDMALPNTRETAVFMRMLRALLSVEYGLYPALTVMAGSNANEPVRLLAARLLAEVNAGSSLLDAMGKYPDIFDSSVRRLIRLGEDSADLMLVALDRAAEYLESVVAGLPEEILIADVATFLTRLATLMELKLTLNEALAEAAEDYTYNPVLRELIVDINNKVGSGSQFSEACASHPEYFDDQSINALEAGEQVGSPENFTTLLRHVADRFSRRASEEAPDAPTFRTSVFISHASENRELVERLIVEPLEQAGINVWYARHAIESASEWERSILKGLEHCEWYLIAMSNEALSSEWVKDELFWAIDNRSDRIIPVALDGCDPAEFHIRMRRLQVIDLAEDNEDGEGEIFRALRRSDS